MSLQQEIDTLEDRLAALRTQLAKGYEIFDAEYDEYTICKEYVSTYDVGGNLAGVIVDAEIVRKYLADNCVRIAEK